MPWLLSVVLLLSLLFPYSSYSTTYYAGTGGSNANPCTGGGGSNATNRNFRKLTVNAGIGCLASGDTLVVTNGTYAETITDYPGTGGYSVTPPSGTSWATATTLQAENQLGAVLHLDTTIGNGWNMEVDFDSEGKDTSYLILDGWLFDGQFTAGTLVTGYTNSHHIRITNGELRDAQDMCVGSGEGSYWEFTHLNIHHCGWTATNNVHCTEASCPTTCGQATNFCYQDAPIYAWAKCHGFCHAFYWKGTGHLVENCTIHDNDDHGFQGYTSVSNVTLRNNYIYNNPGPAIGFYGGSGNVAYNNVLVNSGFGVLSGSGGNTIVSNTVVDWPNAQSWPGWSTNGGIWQKPGTATALKNNILVNAGQSLFIDDGSGNNVLDSSTPAYVAGNLCDTAHGGCTTASGPFFVNPSSGDYHNRSGAPQIDAGMNLGPLYNTDKDGTTRPVGAAWDSGAYEGTGATGPPVATSLAFVQQPTTVTVGSPISPSVTVQILDQYGAAFSSTATVTLTLGTNPTSAPDGPWNAAAVGGLATFSPVSVSLIGSGYALWATSAGLTSAISTTFAVVAAPVSTVRLAGQVRQTDPLAAWSVFLTTPAADRQHPALRAATAWWHVHPLLAGGSRWWDLLASQHGTLTSMTPPSRGWGPTTRPGGAGELRFDGLASTLSLPLATGTLSVTGQYTWVLLIKPGAFAEWSGLLATIATPGDGSQPYLLLYAHTTTDGAFGPVTNGLSVGWHGTGSGNHLELHTVNNVLTAGVWAQVALTYDGTLPQASRMALWVNGTDQTDTTDIDTTGTLASITPTAVQLGQDTFAGDAYWQGAMDDVMRFDRVLTQAELNALRDLAATGWPGVLTRYPFVPRPEYVSITAPSGRKRGGFFQWGQ